MTFIKTKASLAKQKLIRPIIIGLIYKLRAPNLKLNEMDDMCREIKDVANSMKTATCGHVISSTYETLIE